MQPKVPATFATVHIHKKAFAKWHCEWFIQTPPIRQANLSYQDSIQNFVLRPHTKTNLQKQMNKPDAHS